MTLAGHAVMVEVRVVNTVEVVSSGGDDEEPEGPELRVEVAPDEIEIEAVMVGEPETDDRTDEAPDEVETEAVTVDEPETDDRTDVTVAVPVGLELVLVIRPGELDVGVPS